MRHAGEAGGRERDEPWDRLSLAFANADLDGQFWQARVVDTLCRYDLFVYLYLAAHWAALFLVLRPPPATPAFVWVVAYPALMFLELVAIYCSFHRAAMYVAWRTYIVAGARACAIFVTAVTLYAPPPRGSAAVLLCRMLAETPVATSLILGVGLQLPFRLHVAVQFLCCTIAMLLVPMYAGAWDLLSEDPAGHCRSAGSAIDWGVGAVVGGGAEGGEEGRRDQCACCLVMYFLQWAVAFVAPGAFIYCVESYARMDFVLTHGRLTRRERHLVHRAWRRAVPSAVLTVVVSVVVLWELLKATSTLAA